MKYATVKEMKDQLPRSGVWPLVGTRKVMAPCTCCNDFGQYGCDAEQIVSVSTKAPPTIIYGGKRKDGYHFFLFQSGKSLCVRAGCRGFTLSAARKHWGASYYRNPELGRWSLKAIDAMEKKAKKRGWIKSRRR